MEIVNKAKLKEALELLEEAQDLISDGIEIDDAELNGICDLYNIVGDVVRDIEDHINS